MFKNYLLTTLRQLWKHQGYTAINIAGLAVGIAVCLLIALWVKDELQYDQFHQKADRIYRVLWNGKFGDNEWKIPVGPVPVKSTLEDHFPEVEYVTQMYQTGITLKKGTEYVRETEMLYADENFTKVFSIKILSGNVNTALQEPNTIALSQSAAAKYFPNQDPLGQTLLKNDGTPLKVSAVVQDMPTQSHFQFQFLGALNQLQFFKERKELWGFATVYNYFSLKPGTDPLALQKKFQTYLEQHTQEEDFKSKGNFSRFPFQALSTIHLDSNLEMELGVNGKRAYLYIFSIVALFILVLACINFINLSTARSITRAKEVGVRKALGSGRGQLMVQFFGESLIAVVAALIFAVAILGLSLPYFNTLAGKTMQLEWSGLPFLLGLLGLITLFTSLLAGVFPAVVLSGFKTIATLKGQLGSQLGRSRLRESLVVGQFSISTALIIGTMVVGTQFRFLLNSELGFDKERVLLIDRAYALDQNYGVFLEKVRNLPMVDNAGGATAVPGKLYDSTVFAPEQPANFKESSFNYVFADPAYLSTLKVKIHAGRDFRQNSRSDSLSCIINRAMVKKLGWDDPLGKHISGGNGANFQVIGVMEDFHYLSLHHQVEPLIVMTAPWSHPYIAIRLPTGNLAEQINTVKGLWNELAPTAPFEYSFVEDEYQKFYTAEQRLGRVFFLFSVLALFIAGLGLFGLAFYMVARRTKEIGVRKVLGADVSSVVRLLTLDFLRLVLVAVVLAVPIAYLLLQRWLQDFAYRIDMPWWAFVAAGAIALGIALLTVSFQSIRAALKNPVTALKVE
ncbi:MAG TPA: ABC transporter permease [Haliscomenobacter sp.]|uniref:ABC transporter permease n=1 Tax=Haliscomenobacter sp. TaxID=2717303 RepID=UPI002C5DC6B0|nr:ABC transporter permease [Haliscomenobacter sp.]HOY21101.1 ABC transporter permease [Haliscomenobacter sp.]HPH19611.1 ABC transporter permease [Haliscomenobacter sp.]